MSTEQDPQGVETRPFQAEVSQLLRLVINSLYSNREIFLRELVSNASDALDKLRFRAVSEPALLGDEHALRVRVHADEDARTLTIEDNGVGMTRDELAKNLGTIAHSGTRAFLEDLAQKGTPDAKLIGQFGVGFYSAFLVADRVTVESRAAGSTEAWRWSSEARDSFTLEPCEREARGTAVVLHVREEHRDYLRSWKLRELIAKYSDFVQHAIELRDPEKGDEFERVNKGKALWTRPKSEITREQYDALYAHLTDDAEAPLALTHFTVEGSQQFTGLLYIPKSLPFEVLRDPSRGGVRLFVQRVFIMDQCDALLPPWLRFVRGVIDSDDLPLNVSRELLQDSAVSRAIRKAAIRKVLDLLDELARDKKEDYETFWRSFGAVLKEGISLDYEYRERIAALWRFESTFEGDELTSFDAYLSRCAADQKEIYYAIGASRAALDESPHLEALRKAEREVAFFTDPVDEWCVEGLREYKGKKLTSAMRADVKLPDAPKESERKARDVALKPLLDRTRAVLGDRVRDVRSSDRLTDSAACLVLPEGTPHMFVEQVLKQTGRPAGDTRRILEVNPTHPLVEALKTICDRGDNDERLREWIEVLYDQALLTEGRAPEDPNRFAKRVTSLLAQVASTAAGRPSA